MLLTMVGKCLRLSGTVKQALAKIFFVKTVARASRSLQDNLKNSLQSKIR